MHETQPSETKAHLPQDLDEAEIRKTMKLISAFRETMPRLSMDEILCARHEGHKY
jgi:hypothetical protein